ncbi:sensor histidine kinase [Streptomyces sp. NBC_01198]|uniref:sensor histidine kinase n=1 Tax=Streptomyces sp. NBC_01198 TaxID=2903769 RepID=UPI002E10274E|nr:histidine kinase [Streptomyces sp. NBC_01198]
MSGEPNQPAQQLREPDPLAQQLHDGVLQALAVARIRLDRALATPGPLPRELATELRLLVDGEIAGLRRLISGSAPPTPPHPDLPSALAATAEHLQSVTGIRIRVENSAAPRGRWAGNDLVAYRIAREALHNTAKHSGARHAWVTLAARRDRLVCVVSDDGRGFAPPTARPHFGLPAMYAQARDAGGYLAVRSRRTGTFVTLSLPRNPAPQGEAER